MPIVKETNDEKYAGDPLFFNQVLDRVHAILDTVRNATGFPILTVTVGVARSNLVEPGRVAVDFLLDGKMADAQAALVAAFDWTVNAFPASGMFREALTVIDGVPVLTTFHERTVQHFLTVGRVAS